MNNRPINTELLATLASNALREAAELKWPPLDAYAADAYDDWVFERWYDILELEAGGYVSFVGPIGPDGDYYDILFIRMTCKGYELYGTLLG